MKKIFRIIQGIGFVLIMMGAMACDSCIRTSICMIMAGGMLMYGSVKLERNYYFEEKGGDEA